MDEIAGFFPPVANPPSKLPLLTLLKQGRAFGLGVVLATQNPVDLDYKGLSNIGTWFLGRLQTERDKARVLDGLEGAASGGLDRAEADRLLSALGKRVFLLHNVHEKAPRVFQTRWTMSYLRGPLSRDQIWTADGGSQAEAGRRRCRDAAGRAGSSGGSARPTPQAPERPPVLPPGIQQVFLPARGGPAVSAALFSRGARGRAGRVLGYHARCRGVARCRLHRAGDRRGGAGRLVRRAAIDVPVASLLQRAGARRFVPGRCRPRPRSRRTMRRGRRRSRSWLAQEETLELLAASGHRG